MLPPLPRGPAAEYYGLPVRRVRPGEYSLGHGMAFVRRVKTNMWVIEELGDREARARYLSASAALSRAAYVLTNGGKKLAPAAPKPAAGEHQQESV